MPEDPQGPSGTNTATRSAFWASLVFYGVVAFEFFYMFSPFAAYVYSVYGPGLDVLGLSASTSWLISFFMPHIARVTQSFFLTWHEVIGGIVFAGSVLAFLVGAGQIYWNKLTDGDAVMGGVYRYIRHPQYLALMVASFGMVLLWPRYLVVFGFVTVCFAYVLLARTEERICSRKYPEYDAYQAETGMFLPPSLEAPFRRLPWPSGRIGRIATAGCLYAGALVLSFVVARAVHAHTVDSLYTHSTETAVYLSLGQMATRDIAQLAEIARSNPEVRVRMADQDGSDVRFINYVMPTDLLVSEVPMHIPEGRVPGHEWPSAQDQRRYKIIFTSAHFGPGGPGHGRDILLRAVNKSPIVEVWIDRSSQSVEHVLDPPNVPFYDGMPVPVL